VNFAVTAENGQLCPRCGVEVTGWDQTVGNVDILTGVDYDEYRLGPLSDTVHVTTTVQPCGHIFSAAVQR
jgi:hypothetical protein